MAKQVIAVIGAGGKTTAMGVLARQCGARSVLVTTTTHMFPLSVEDCDRCLIHSEAEALVSALAVPGVVCAGSITPEGKLGKLPEIVLQAGIEAADVVIYEADGSRGLPLKLHRAYEPVLLPETTCCLVVAGLSALGRPVSQVIHRCEMVPEWRDCPDKRVDVAEFVRCVLESVDSVGGCVGQLRVFLNQEDCCEKQQTLEGIKAALCARGLDVKSGSLQAPPEEFCDWIVNG